MPPTHEENEQERLSWLTEIYNRYANELQRFISIKVKEPFLAEDLTSTVFLKALRWLKRDQGDQQIRAWLYSTARTTIADYWEERELYETRTLAGLEERFFVLTVETNQQEVEKRVEKLLGLLSEREERVLRLRYLQGYTAAEIARLLDTTAGHIRVLQLRALRRAAQLESQERKVYTMEEQEIDTVIQLLTAESRRVLELSKEEAINLHQGFIGTEHLLWGLAKEGSLNAFLTPAGITPERVHTGMVFIYSRQPLDPNISPPQAMDAHADASKVLTPRTRQMLLLAAEEMRDQGEQRIKPAHLFLGLINEGSGIGAGLLRSLGVNLVQARAGLVKPGTGQICSFCGRTGSQVKRIFPAEGPASLALICNECVEKFHALLL